MAQYNNVKNKMTSLITQEEVFWQQRSKVSWLKDGDLNTRFFHVSATCRAKMNKIKKLQVDDSVIVEEKGQIEEAARNYLLDMFMQRQGSYDQVVGFLSQRVDGHDNAQLVQPFGRAEFHAALQQMGSDKAPGPDGNNPAFHKHFWEHMVRKSLMLVALG